MNQRFDHRGNPAKNPAHARRIAIEDAVALAPVSELPKLLANALIRASDRNLAGIILKQALFHAENEK